MSVEAIATQRQLTTGLVAGHLVQLGKPGYDIDSSALIAPTDQCEIEKAIAEAGFKEGRSKPVFDHLSVKYD